MKLKSVKSGLILMVDDNPANLAVLSDYLDEVGFETRVAQDGESALQKVEYEMPDLILLDVMMPGIDGFETCRQLKVNPLTEDIPVIFMSALSDTVDKVKGLELGAVDYITKPFQQEEVLARVRVHLGIQSLTKVLGLQNIVMQMEIKERIAAETALQLLTQNLEKNVKERTIELSHTLNALKRTQLYLVQSEKMSSLGQLIAGVAHEINNPVGFMSNNLEPAAEYVANLIKILNLYRQNYPSPHPEIQQALQETDLEFAIQDLPKIVQAMKVGTGIVGNISVSLRNFCRSDTASLISANIHEGLESTLLILGHRLKSVGRCPEITIVKDYGAIPNVMCYPGQLNQVFMNILANAIDALEEERNAIAKWRQQNQDSQEVYSTALPTITIRTELTTPEMVTIRISDNGIGITSEVMQRLFEPMFTTKPLNHGTGLGLSISRKIVVEAHNGQLTCVSTPGIGTEFIIDLPANLGASPDIN